MENKWKNKSFFSSFINALKGIKYVLKTGRNIKIQMIFAILAIMAGIVFKITLVEFSIVVFAIFFVLTCEFFNTAIEIAIDMYTEEYNEKAKIAKDVAAGSVVFSAICSVIIGLIIFLPKVIEFLK